MNAEAKTYVKVLLGGALIGIPVSLAAVLFTTVVHDLQHLLFTDLPDAFGWDEAPWWMVIILPGIGGALAALALLLPGHGGHTPLEGLGMDPQPPRYIFAVLGAAIASLGFGVVLGPEAPLIALGLTIGTIAGKLIRAGEMGNAVIPLAGAFAAISTIFGGPLTSSLMLFEVGAASGKIRAADLPRVLLPGLVAAGVGAIVFTGVGKIDGVHSMELSLPGLEPYKTLRMVDIGWGLVIAVVAAVVIEGAQRMAWAVSAVKGRRIVLMVLGGLGIGALAALFRAISDKPVDLILFSGQDSMGAVIAETSALVLLGVIVAKGLAYVLSLSLGFRGGPVFPAVFLGAAVGALAAAVLPGAELTPAIIAGVAAGTAAALRLAFVGVLLAALLGISAGKNVIPVAILASTLAWLVAIAIAKPRDEGAEAAAGGDAAGAGGPAAPGGGAPSTA